MDNLIAFFNDLAIVDWITNVLPTLAAAVGILLIGWLAARFISRLIGRLAARFNFDRLIAQTGLAGGLKQIGVDQTPSKLLERLIYWVILLNVIIITLNFLGLAEVIEPLNNAIQYLPRVLSALVVVILGSLAADFVGRAVSGITENMGVEFNEALGRVTQILIMGMVIILTLDQLGLDTALLNNLFLLLIVIGFAGVSLAFGLGGRDLARGILAGYYARESFEVGNRVVIDGFEGVIESIGSLNTEIVGDNGRLVIPNTRLTDSNVRVVEG